MKTLASAAKTAIEAGEAIVTGAVEITPTVSGAVHAFDGGAFDSGAFDAGAGASATVIRVWGGYGNLTISGNVFKGIGDRAFAQQTAGAIGGVAQGMTLGLSGVEPDALKLLDAGEIKNASVVITRLIFGPDGKTLLDAHIFDRGRGDAIASEETIGGAASIQFAVESTARGLGRNGARMQSDADQRLIDSADGYMRNKGYAPEKQLFWGGKKPTRSGAAIGGSGSGSGISERTPTVVSGLR